MYLGHQKEESTPSSLVGGFTLTQASVLLLQKTSELSEGQALLSSPSPVVSFLIPTWPISHTSRVVVPLVFLLPQSKDHLQPLKI